jgi:hypothetical protein
LFWLRLPFSQVQGLVRGLLAHWSRFTFTLGPGANAGSIGDGFEISSEHPCAINNNAATAPLRVIVRFALILNFLIGERGCCDAGPAGETAAGNPSLVRAPRRARTERFASLLLRRSR